MLLGFRPLAAHLIISIIIYAQFIYGYIDEIYLIQRVSSIQVIYLVEEVIRKQRGLIFKQVSHGVPLWAYLVSAIIGDLIVLYLYVIFNIMMYYWIFIHLNKPVPSVDEVVLFALLYSFTSLSFSYFLSLWFWNPFLAFGIGHVFFSFLSFYLSQKSAVFGAFLPHVVGILEFYHQFGVKSSTLDYKIPIYVNIILLCAQGVVYYLCYIVTYQILFKYSHKSSRSQSSLVLACDMMWTQAAVKYDLQVSKGQITGILGPSQSGKSDFIKLLLGLKKVKQYQGEALFFGENILTKKTRDFSRIGYCLDYQILEEDFTIVEYVSFIG